MLGQVIDSGSSRSTAFFCILVRKGAAGVQLHLQTTTSCSERPDCTKHDHHSMVPKHRTCMCVRHFVRVCVVGPAAHDTTPLTSLAQRAAH
jgi:hypothetical protein